MKIGDNLKILRKRAGKSQEDVANDLGFNRSTYSGYENGVAQPNIENLIALSKYYELSIDVLLSENFQDFSEKDWRNHDKNWKVKASGNNLRVLTSQVTEGNDELIELVTHKASAGYVSSYADVEFINELPTIRLPFLSKNKKYRAFSISGDSMPPVVEGSFVVGEFVQDWTAIKSGTPCLVDNDLVKSKSFLLVSTNSFFQPYELGLEDVVEIWQFVNYISSILPSLKIDDNDLSTSIRSIQIDIHRILNANKS
jgi:transcriptional regulator with XRE-family HTH domain